MKLRASVEETNTFRTRLISRDNGTMKEENGLETAWDEDNIQQRCSEQGNLGQDEHQEGDGRNDSDERDL